MRCRPSTARIWASTRYIVFQVLPHTLGLGPDVWRVLSKCHDLRNRTEYEGALDVDERLVTNLISACRKVADKIKELPTIPPKSKSASTHMAKRARRERCR
jgi:hypothetical protein